MKKLLLLTGLLAPLYATDVKLTWTPSTSLASNPSLQYVVERKAEACTGTGAFTQIKSGIAGNATTYTDTALGAGTYCYQMRSYVGTNVSGPSNNPEVVVPQAPAPPTGVTGTVIQVLVIIP